MKIYYEKSNFVLSQGKLYFELGKDIVTNGSEYVWTCDEVFAMELGFITCFRPKFNQAGVDVWYRLNKIQ